MVFTDILGCRSIDDEPPDLFALNRHLDFGESLGLHLKRDNVCVIEEDTVTSVGHVERYILVRWTRASC